MITPSFKEAALAGKGMGKAWYPTAVSVVRTIARQRGVSVGVVADVMALTSPRIQVRRNVALTLDYLSHRDPTALGCIPTVKKSLEHWARTGVIRGPKTSAFARALRGDHTAVVVDTWMFKAASERPGTRSAFRRVEEAVRTLAATWELSPRDTQAAVWAGYQLLIGRTPALLSLDMLREVSRRRKDAP